MMRMLLAQNSLYYPSHGGGDKSNRMLMEALAARFESLQEQAAELRRLPVEAVPDAGRAALNLNKRAQVLRMHRR